MMSLKGISLPFGFPECGYPGKYGFHQTVDGKQRSKVDHNANHGMKSLRCQEAQGNNRTKNLREVDCHKYSETIYQNSEHIRNKDTGNDPKKALQEPAWQNGGIVGLCLGNAMNKSMNK